MTAHPTSAVSLSGRKVRPAWSAMILSGLAIVLLVALPYLVFQDITSKLVMLFILIMIASMWNLLAGFAGLVSVGQQAYLGLGAYAALGFAQVGVQPWLAIPLAAVTCAVIALPTSWLAFRLRGDYFAVGTWVIAEVYRLLIIRVDWLGGPSGASITQLNSIDPVLRGAITYWVALVCAVATIAGCVWLLRGRIGLALSAVRDNEGAAGALGVEVVRSKRIVYLVAAAGAGAAGGVLLVLQLGVQPNAVFSVQWSAYMIFIVVLGGIGKIEGPILGAIVFFFLQDALSDYGSWYLIVLGLVAMAAAAWLPNGLWGVFDRITGYRVFPVGYVVDGAPVRQSGFGQRVRTRER